MIFLSHIILSLKIILGWLFATIKNKDATPFAPTTNCPQSRPDPDYRSGGLTAKPSAIMLIV